MLLISLLRFDKNVLLLLLVECKKRKKKLYSDDRFQKFSKDFKDVKDFIVKDKMI